MNRVSRYIAPLLHSSRAMYYDMEVDGEVDDDSMASRQRGGVDDAEVERPK